MLIDPWQLPAIVTAQFKYSFMGFTFVGTREVLDLSIGSPSAGHVTARMYILNALASRHSIDSKIAWTMCYTGWPEAKQSWMRCCRTAGARRIMSRFAPTGRQSNPRDKRTPNNTVVALREPQVVPENGGDRDYFGLICCSDRAARREEVF